MNIHLAQTIQARNELERIANVKYQIISAKDSNPIIGCVQDSLSGAYIMSMDNNIDYGMACNLLCNTSSLTKSQLKKGGTFNGKQVFSHIIPEGINSVKKKGKDIIFQIKNGELLEGQLDKSQLSTSKNSIIHYVWDKYGPTPTQKFIDDTQRLILNYLLDKGLTVGLKDCIIPMDLVKQLREIIHTKIISANHTLTQYENDYDKITPETGDGILSMELNAISSNIGKLIMDVLDKDNGLNVMISSKSKGSVVNMTQMTGCLGQMLVESQRIKKRVTGRTLSIFHQNDDTPAARGFIGSSFLDGLKGYEFFFHTMSGREGLIDTAIKSVTADTPLIIMENGKVKRINIGEWIDNYLDNNKDIVKHYDDRNLELLKLEKLNIKSYIPTADSDGNVSWGEITAITRHDPGDTLYEIITMSGRKVIVTESKSLLIWNKDIRKFIHMDTPNVKIGDYVPVTMNLETPPIIKTYVDVSEYLSKKEYIYGTDFNKACEMLNEELSDRKKVSAGWWETHNGSSFTLPYPQALKLRRTMERSNIEHIKNKCIYPYSAFRQDIQFEEKFKLDKENGQFIGLFLAEGNADIKSGYVGITNNDMNIINFAKVWFEKRSIKTKTESYTNKIGGKSTTIRGYSTILAKFLTLFVGHGARNKYIPNEAYTAPEEFIVGLIDGYISGDGCITENAIQVSSASYELVEGISNLLNRLGIFAKMNTTHLKKNNLGTIDIAPINMISIRAQWAKLFSEKIKLMDINKQEKLNNINATLSHRNYEPINDVILDAIVKINIINKEVVMKKYPKVYDLTIPSTLNFGLANGLHVVDTAETGYIQRKCIKFLEDLLVNYEGLIRTANGVLVQYLYGDSGIDQQKQTQVKLNLINLNNNAIKEQFTFSNDEIKQLEKKYKIDLDKFNKKMYEKMVDMRDKLRKIYFLSTGNYKVIEDSFMLPINLLRISQEIESEDEMSMDPNYIIEQIEDLLTNYDDRFITMMKKDSKLLKDDDQAYKFMLRIGLYEYIAPRKCLFEYKISKKGFDDLIEDIRISLSRALVEPGEMVGVVAAQSIGEPTSQLTMNTKHSAGKAGVSGVSRIKEIMSYSKSIKSPQMTIYFEDKYSNKNDANLISSYLKHLTIRELISSAEILYSMDNKDSLSKLLDSDNVSNPFFINNDTQSATNIKTLPFVIRLTMNLEKMMEKETTLLDIKTKFITYWYKNFSNIKNVKKSHKDILVNVDKLAVLSNNDNIIHIRFRLNDFNYSLLTNFLNIVLDVITLKGIDHIDNVNQSQERRITFNEEGETVVEKEYIATTEGINLEGLKMLKGINHSRTKINDIHTVYINYGIEAARNVIIYELLTTYEANGAGINHAHMSLLVDMMTYSGEVISIDRHGMNKVDNDPISKASFEKTMEHFINAAIFCETDKMTSVSSRIALGRVINGGTGSFDLILDTEKLKNSEYIENETGGRTNFIPLTIEPLFGDVIKNGFARNDFFIPE
jgi:DNA-directed RNA polymerase beta' subunit